MLFEAHSLIGIIRFNGISYGLAQSNNIKRCPLYIRTHIMWSFGLVHIINTKFTDFSLLVDIICLSFFKYNLTIHY